MSETKNRLDYQDFINSEEINPPKELDEKILSFVKKELDPSHQAIFLKLIGIQAFIGLLSMLFCPQFNLSLTNSYDLFHYFHYNFGESICMLICGSIFVGSGAIFAAYTLNLAEVKKIHKSSFLYFTSISILSISVFMILGTKLYLNLVFFWFIGATLSSVILFNFNKVVRSKILLS